jgi:antitoxin (DNA-binding transcriptional repressor) of toxin-antitoxin stability system
MDTVDLAHAKEHLEDLIARAAKGEVVYIRDPVLGTVKVPSRPRHAQSGLLDSGRTRLKFRRAFLSR